MLELPENIKKFINDGNLVLLKGYLTFLTEDQIKKVVEIVKNSSLWEGGIPFAYTAFGDVLVWNDEFIELYKFKDGVSNVIMSGSEFFFTNIKDTDYQKDFFEVDLYKEAVSKMDLLDKNEVFGFEPLLALGGTKKVDYLKKVKFPEYLELICLSS